MAVNDGLVCCEVCDQPITGVATNPVRGITFAIPCYDTLDEDQWDTINREIAEYQKENARERTDEA